MQIAIVLPLLAAAILAAGGSDRSTPLIVTALHGGDLSRIEALLAQSKLPRNGPIGQALEEGGRALVVPVDPALTSTARVTMLTGAPPSRHGIVGNVFLKNGTPTSGFGTPFAAETLWEAGLRQGRRVVRVGSLFPSGSRAPQAGDYVIASGRVLAASQVMELAPGNLPKTSSSAPSAEHAIRVAPAGAEAMSITGRPGEAPLHMRVHAVDMQKDGKRAFDGIILDDDDDPSNGWKALLRTGDWAPLELAAGSGRAGRWLKLMTLDKENGDARLYIGAAYEGRGYPADFLAAVEQETGFYPGSPDYDRLRNGTIDEKTWMEQMERENRYLADAAITASSLESFDLLILDQPAIDNAAHQFLLTDPRQGRFEDSAGRARFQAYIESAYRLVDENLKRLIQAQRERTRLALISDYSLLPVHSRYDVNAILHGAGFRSDGEAPEIRALASSTSAHIYLDRSQVAEPDSYLERAARVLRSFRDPSGEAVFEDVLTQEQQKSRNLFFANTSGDLWVRARPGYALSSRRDRMDIISDEPPLPGEHGYNVSGPAGMGMMIIGSDDFKSLDRSSFCAVDVAAIVSEFAGMDSPRDWTPPQLPRSVSAEDLRVRDARDCARGL